VVGLVVLGGLGFGVTLACLAGARRTETAFDRFVAASHPGDVEVSFEDQPLDEKLALIERVVDLPQVERAAGGSWVLHALPDGTRDAVIPIVALDENFGHDLNVPRLIEGRFPDPDRADELYLNELAADDLDLGPGDTIDLVPVAADQFDLFFSNEPLEGEPRTFTVTGVARFPDDLEAFGGSRFAFLTPAYWEETAGDLAFLGPTIVVDAAPGQQQAFVDAVSEFIPPSSVEVLGAEDPDVTVGDATHVQALALTLFAAVLGVATLAFVALGYSRQVLAADEDTEALLALGMDRRRRGLVVAAPILVAALASGALAVGVAVTLSPIFPFGLGGRAEPDPGLHVDAGVVLSGALAAAVVLAALGGLLALAHIHWPRRARAAAERTLPLPLVAGIGVGLATRSGRGRRAVPVRSVLVTATLGVALLVATLTFGHSLDRLVSDPERYGWNVDVIFGSSDDPENFEDIAPVLEEDERVGEWASASVVELAAGEHAFWTMGIESVEGDIEPVIIEGQAPAADDEIALGRRTLDDLDVSIGDDLEVAPADGGEPTTLRVVGTSVLPGGDHDFPGGLGSGGVMTLDGLRLVADAPRHVYLVRVAPGLDPAEVLAEVQAEGPGTYGPAGDPKIHNLEQASGVIPAMAAAVAVLAVIALTHALTVTVRRRRHDLAVLGSLGMRPRQLRRVVLWQAAVIGVISLIIGIPVGVVLAAPAWRAAARDIGVADDLALLRPGVVAVLVVGIMAVTLAVAIGPAMAASRTRPGVTLRAE
jgi:putative ABC transport system permease protein